MKAKLNVSVHLILIEWFEYPKNEIFSKYRITGKIGVTKVDRAYLKTSPEGCRFMQFYSSVLDS